ncbi:MAG: DNA polymerase-4 [Halieaceae bacterium]|jgi:DNA polymerase-4
MPDTDIDTLSRPRKIIHVDADSFYASVEIREDPSLATLPIAVGGQANQRGVIATCNYMARKFGVHSAMASSRALQLCPQLRIVRPRFELYRQVSQQFRDIFSDYTDLIEPLSLDEAYLDVTESPHCRGSATLIAEEIRIRVRQELHLSVSAGIAPNKFLAKVASDWNKPDGSFTITPEQVADFVLKLPVSKINGVGRVTANKLSELGVETCGDLQQVPLDTLLKRFGKYGNRLADVARGVDHRAVKPTRTRKSISVETTYREDLQGVSDVVESIADILVELEGRFVKISKHYQPSKRVIKVKFKDFTQTTIEEMITGDPAHWLDHAVFERLLVTAWQRGAKPVRLLGAGLRLNPVLGNEDSQQPDLFGQKQD